MQSHITLVVVACLLVSAGFGLFLYNMFLARQGWLGMKQARAQKAAADAEFVAMQALTARSNALREALKTSFGKDYARVVEPIDELVSHSLTALLANDPKSAMELLNEACLEMEALLRPRSV